MMEADLEAVMRIQDECYTSIIPESGGSLLAKLRASPGTCLVAMAADRPIGYAIAVPVAYPHLPELDAPRWDPPEHADTLYLHDLAVATAARGTGAGDALARRMLEVAIECGWRQLCLVAIQGSVPYWARYGFEEPPGPQADMLTSYGADARLMRLSMQRRHHEGDSA